MKKIVLLLCLIALFLSGCATMDMRKISVEPKISTENMQKSSLKAGLLLNDQFTNYKYAFETGTQLYLLSKVQGEIAIGKNLSHALYGLVSSKFGNVAIAKDAREIQDVSVYFVPRIKYFNYSPPFTGMGSHTADVELETEIFAGNGQRLRSFIVKGKGSRNMINQLIMKTNYDMAHYAVNEAIDNLLKEFSRKLDEFY
ncbi:MAG: hypothetical protein Q7J27_05560 [Syntrophales bacterium]|nr:hypothetical protein [Syntrophales bacterium]